VAVYADPASDSQASGAPIFLSRLRRDGGLGASGLSPDLRRLGAALLSGHLLPQRGTEVSMDGSRFDTLAKTLAASGSRRVALRGLLAGVLAVVGGHQTQDATAKSVKQCKKISDKQKRQKCLKKARHQTTPPAIPTGGTVVIPPPPTPLPATCSDGIHNGSETDVDCGGPECDRCDVGQRCLGAADCETSFCVDNVCQACIRGQCPEGCDCTVATGGICANITFVLRPVCADCPRYSYCPPGQEGGVECYPPCG
jgi:hypothetical protein